MKKILPLSLFVLIMVFSINLYCQCASTANIYQFSYNGKNYEIVKGLKTWVNAAACAVERGGYLVHIDDQNEQDTIYDAIINGAGISSTYASVWDGGGVAYVWIGATDINTEGIWLWDGNNDNIGTNFWNGQGIAGTGGGSAVGGAYNNWGNAFGETPNEPDNSGNQDAAGIALEAWPFGTPGEWNDIIITNNLYFIIEYGTSFNYTGSAQTYTVPTCVNSISVDVKGAGGTNSSTSNGGNGGRVQATIAVTPGEVLNIYVGQKSSSLSGGWNGGGNGGGGGGGASDIRRGGSALSNRIIVAGGGGGAGICTLNDNEGGRGGGLTGTDGWDCGVQGGTNAGKGGTQTTGGAGLQSGSLGNGGNGSGMGGGGGGGYYGGGGGGSGGGGGGSSYTESTATGVVHTQGFQSGDGEIIIIPIVSTGPAMPGPIIGTSSVCAGSLQTYSVSSVTGATSYIWTLPSGWSGSSTSNSIDATVGATGGNITVKATNPCGTSAASTLALIVTTTLVANAGPDTSICAGGAVTLNASGGSNYSWSPAGGLSCTICPSPIANPSATTDYVVSVSNGTCTSDIDTIQVTVNPLPLANAGNDVTICSGDSVRLNATGGTSYNWSPSTGLNNPNIANPVANPATTTTYMVNVTDVNGCVNEDSVIVNVTTVLIANAGTDVSVCEGDTIGLNASGGSTYFWSPATGLSCVNCPDPMANPSITTTYEVTVSSGSCTPASDMVEVTVNSPNADAGLDVIICSGSSTTLNATGGITYSWSPSTGLNDPNIPNPEASPTNTTDYVVTITDVYGCEATATVTVTVDICGDISPISRNIAVLVFPNPINGTLNIQIDKAEMKKLSFRIMNIQGQGIYSDKIDKVPDKYSKQLDVSSFAKGVYYLEIIADEDYSIRKLIFE